MTVCDTTYFISDPHQWKHVEDKDRWKDSFHFLGLSNKNRNYTDEEIREQLEIKVLNQ